MSDEYLVPVVRIGAKVLEQGEFFGVEDGGGGVVAGDDGGGEGVGGEEGWDVGHCCGFCVGGVTFMEYRDGGNCFAPEEE